MKSVISRASQSKADHLIEAGDKIYFGDLFLEVRQHLTLCFSVFEIIEEIVCYLRCEWMNCCKCMFCGLGISSTVNMCIEFWYFGIDCSSLCCCVRLSFYF